MARQGLVTTVPVIVPRALGGCGAVGDESEGRAAGAALDDVMGVRGCGAPPTIARSVMGAKSGDVFIRSRLSADGCAGPAEISEWRMQVPFASVLPHETRSCVTRFVHPRAFTARTSCFCAIAKRASTGKDSTTLPAITMCHRTPVP